MYLVFEMEIMDSINFFGFAGSQSKSPFFSKGWFSNSVLGSPTYKAKRKLLYGVASVSLEIWDVHPVPAFRTKTVFIFQSL